MSPALAKHVHEVISHGLDLKERLEQSKNPLLEPEHKRLHSLLVGGSELRNNPEYSGTADVRQTGAGGRFLGARYALTCWLDEIFIIDSPWSEQWNERKLEFAIYTTDDRFRGFWEQAALAEQRPGTDALEVYYWCVMLGFRGKWRDDSQNLTAWAAMIRDRIRRAHRVDLTLPPDQGFETRVPRLTGQGRFAGMVKLAGLLTLLAVPVLVALVLRRMAT